MSEKPEPARLYLGAMNFGDRTPENEAKAIIGRALELGITHIDTANVYEDGASERIVGQAVRGKRDQVVLATKCGLDSVNGKREGLSRPRLLAAIDESLTRLGVDYVDIYYLHAPDHKTPIEETLDGVAELLEKRKIKSWGISNYASWQVLEMIHLADARKMSRPVVAQQLYNVLFRELDIEWFAFARRYAIQTIVYNPLAGGLLSGKHTRDGATQKGSRFEGNRMYQGRYWSDTMFDRVDALTKLAKAEKMSLIELSYAWVAGAPGVDSVLLGPATVSQLEEGVAACARGLSPEVRGLVNALFRVWMGTDASYVR